ncbi:MAG: hypothetical protein AAGE85_10190 [Pseudomonadota bacterium]
MLAELQQQLTDIYRIDATHDVRDYLITDPRLAKLLSQDAMLSNTDETLLVSEDQQGMLLSLFLDGDMLERLEALHPLEALGPHQLDDFWKVLEGISHFNCMTWKASRDRSVSLLELELQGEIDKCIATLMLAEQQNNELLADRVHGWLFEEVRYNDELSDDERARYRAANDYAARYCHRLCQRWQNGGDLPVDELRQFFRLQLNDKISHIHSQAWAAN